MFTPTDWPRIDSTPTRGQFLLANASPKPAMDAQTSADAAPSPQTAPEHSGAVAELFIAFAAPVVVWWVWRRGWLGIGRLSGRWLGALAAPEMLVLAGGFYISIMVAGLLAALAGERCFGGDAVAVKGFAALVTYALAIAGAAVVLRVLRRGRGARAMGAGDGDGREGSFAVRVADVPRGVVAFVLAAPVIVAVSLAAVMAARAVSGKAPEPVAHDLLRLILDNRAIPWAWCLAAAAVVGAPIVEEVTYRGLLQSALLKATGRARVSIVATSALFALAHLPAGAGVPYHALATLFVLSVCMGLAYEVTRSLCVPVMMHVCFNAANVVLALLTL